MTGQRNRMPPAIVVMGVSGCGKSVVGQALSERLGAIFIEGDSLHPPENIARMAGGIPLRDEDRLGWLDAIGRRIAASAGGGRRVVAACSALKRAYRERLLGFCRGILFVYLETDLRTAERRVAERTHHFMSASLVGSQFAILEPPGEDEAALTLDATLPVHVLVSEIAEAL